VFLQKYISEENYECILEEYNDKFLSTLNEKQFLEVCSILKRNNIYCIEDIIVNFLELFTLEVSDLEKRITKLKEQLGKNYNFIIGSDLRFVNLLLEEDMT